MPTYSYRCTECDTAFDIQQSFTDESLTVCPTCQGRLRKVFSAIGVSFNGSGFYRNDSRSTTSSSDSAKPAAASAPSSPAAAPAAAPAPSAPASGTAA